MSETTEERRKKRIEKLKAQLQKEEALAVTSLRKERNGQLIAFGVYVEEYYKGTDKDGQERLLESIKKHLKGRNLDRALAGIKRISNS